MGNAFEDEIKREINILKESIDKKTITLSDRSVDNDMNIKLVNTVLDNFFGYLIEKQKKKETDKQDFIKTIQAFRDQLRGK